MLWKVLPQMFHGAQHNFSLTSDPRPLTPFITVSKITLKLNELYPPRLIAIGSAFHP